MTKSSPASALAGGSGIKALVGVAAILISLLYLRSVSHRGAPVPEVAKPSLAMSMAADREPTDEPPRPETVRAAPRPLAKAAPEAKRSGPGAAFLLQRPATKEAPIGLTWWSAETLGPAPDEPRIAPLKPPSEPPAPALGSNVEPSTALQSALAASRATSGVAATAISTQPTALLLPPGHQALEQRRARILAEYEALRREAEMQWSEMLGQLKGLSPTFPSPPPPRSLNTAR
jgi:hypothetical protein